MRYWRSQGRGEAELTPLVISKLLLDLLDDNPVSGPIVPLLDHFCRLGGEDGGQSYLRTVDVKSVCNACRPHSWFASDDQLPRRGSDEMPVYI